MSIKVFSIKKERVFLCALFLLYLTRYMITGFKYYPILDDYIQYYWYANAYENVSEVFWGIGTLATRPLAGIFDIYFWSKLYDVPYIIVFLNALISFFGVFFLSRTLREMNVQTGAAFYIIILFLPIGTEAAYWLSASSRVIVGVFVSTLSMRIFSLYDKSKNKLYLLCFFVCQLFSMCFYEQVAIFSLILCTAYFYRTKQKSNMYLICVINICIIALYYLLFRNVGAFSSRIKIILPSDIISHLVFIKKELYNIMIDGIFSLSINSFIRGALFLKTMPLVAFAIIILSYVSSFLYMQMQNKKDIFVLLFGFGVIIFSLVPMIITDNSSLPYRTMYVPLIGVAVSVDYLFGRIKWETKCAFLMMFAFLLVFSVGCISEINDYKTVSDTDALICKNIVNALNEDVLSGEREIYLLGAKRSYTTLSALHNEHIISVTSSDWAFTGALRYYAKGYIKKAVPVLGLTDENINTSALLFALCDDFSVNIIRE